MYSVLSEAIIYAAAVFDGKVRKCGGQPAVLHSLEAAVIVSGMTDDEEIIIAALLHDTVEDTAVTPDELRERFGERVTKLVLSETENKRLDTPPDKTWLVRKQEAVEVLKNSDDIGVKLLFLGDKLSNIRSLYNAYKLQGSEIWQNFNQKDPHLHRWYYRTVADALTELKAYPAWQEYDRLIKLLFNDID